MLEASAEKTKILVFSATLRPDVPNGSNERLDRIEANLDRLTEWTLQTAERQSAVEHKIDRLFEALTIDAENIRALARIAEAHERRL